MHHSDFHAHESLAKQVAEQNESEATWIRRYNHRQACMRKQNRAWLMDCILWILSVILLLGVFNFPFILRLFS